MAVTAAMVKELREMTGAGMMDCKKALAATDGDMEKAVEFLREKGLAGAAKKAGRIAAEGIVATALSADEKKAVVVEVNAETDFVAKNAEFQNFVKVCADTVMQENPADLDTLLACKAAGTDMTVEALVRDKVLTIGENIKIRRFVRYEGVVATYIHGGGRIGVLVKFDTTPEIAAKEEFKAYAKDICMQVAAANPGYLNEASVPADVIEHERKILTEQVINEGKPAQIAEKIVNGKMGKYYKENCLVDQLFVKDGDYTVAKYTDKIGKDLGGKIEIVSFVRYEKGEGLEKKSDNFADEVASMIK